MNILYFHAPWCAPCRAVSPVIDAAEKRHPGVSFSRVDVSAHPAYAAQFHIQSVPTVLILKGDRVVAQAGAVTEAALDALIAGAT